MPDESEPPGIGVPFANPQVRDLPGKTTVGEDGKRTDNVAGTTTTAAGSGSLLAQRMRATNSLPSSPGERPAVAVSRCWHGSRSSPSRLGRVGHFTRQRTRFAATCPRSVKKLRHRAPPFGKAPGRAPILRVNLRQLAPTVDQNDFTGSHLARFAMPTRATRPTSTRFSRSR